VPEEELMAIRGIGHAVLRVADVEAATAWYRDVVGLAELDSPHGIVALGCGGDATMDVGLVEGGAGLESFSLSVGDDRTLDELAARIDGVGIRRKDVDRRYVGIADGFGFDMPTGHAVEVLRPADDAAYLHPTRRHILSTDGPLDLDHLNLQATDVREAARFLVDVLGFRISDVFEIDGRWLGAWCRVGEWHHDIAIAETGAGTLLHHVSFLTQGIGQHEHLADRIARFGHTIEWGIGRHGPGGNLFTYTRDPAGNRVELTAEMGRVPDPETPTRFWSDPMAMLNQWGVAPPPTFLEGT
jgi:catechol 2,3-dioxygenase